MNTPSLIDHPQVTQILFHPRGEWGYAPSQVAVELHFPVENGVTLGGRLYRTATPHGPWLLYWHGNGEIAADYEDIATLYTEMGFHFLVVDFRGYGLSTATPSGTTLLQDAVAVVDLLESVAGHYAPGLDNLFVMGRSMGSAAAIEIAVRRPEKIKGLILESGFAFSIALIERLGGLSLEGVQESEGFDSLEKMRTIRAPSLLIHGEEDVLIPVTDSQALFDICPAENKKLVKIPNSGHNDLMMNGISTYFESIAQFVASIYTP